MINSNDWTGPFQFENAYDQIGAPQYASRAEIESILEDLQSSLRILGHDEGKRRVIEAAAATLLDEERREHHNHKPETRLLAIQDPVARYPVDWRSQAQRIESLLGGTGIELRDYSQLSVRSQSPTLDQTPNQGLAGDSEA